MRKNSTSASGSQIASIPSTIIVSSWKELDAILKNQEERQTASSSLLVEKIMSGDDEARHHKNTTVYIFNFYSTHPSKAEKSILFRAISSISSLIDLDLSWLVLDSKEQNESKLNKR